MKRFKFIEHTADEAVLVFGGSLKELFVSAALAMNSVLVSKKQNRKAPCLKEVSFKKTAESIEDLLKLWLDELLYVYSSDKLILKRIKSLKISGLEFEAAVLFDDFDKDYYEAKSEIKAVTYHELKVEKIRGRWRARIIFDV